MSNRLSGLAKVRAVELTRRQFAGAAAMLSARRTRPPSRAQGKPLHIGMVSPLSGPAAPFGVEYAEGARVYVEAWNKRGGVDGRKVEFDLVDDESSSIGAVNAFKKHATNSDTSLIWVGTSSSATLAIKPLASEYKVPIIAGGVNDAIGIPADPICLRLRPERRTSRKLWYNGPR